MKNLAWRIYMLVCALLFLVAFVSYGQTTNTVVTAESTQIVIPGIATIERGQLTFGLDRIPELRRELLGIPIWQYAATILYIFLAIIAARLFNYLVTVQLRKLANRTKTRLDDLIIDLLHGPLRILALVFLLQLGLNLFQWPLWLEHWFRNGFKLILAFSLTLLVLKMVDMAEKYWRKRPIKADDKGFNDLLIPLISKSLKAFLIIMAILVTLDNLNFNIRTLLAGVSISGLALGLAAQDTVGNLFGAAAVFVDKPFKIGDRIQLNGIDGVVEEMGLRSTRVRNGEGHLITVPNKTMGNATITNVTRRPNLKTVINFGLTYNTPAEKLAQAVDILENVYRKHPRTGDLIVGFNQFGDNALNIQVTHFWTASDHKEYVAGMQEMNLQIKRLFDEAKIDFAFPSRTVYLRQDNDWAVKVSASSSAPV